jgi:ABC-type siderophore export system fused ATPase/permease subunit
VEATGAINGAADARVLPPEPISAIAVEIMTIETIFVHFVNINHSLILVLVIAVYIFFLSQTIILLAYLVLKW